MPHALDAVMATKRKPRAPTIPPITEIVVQGFKSHRHQLSLTLAPLTVLSGANSSGKSSVMQALLLLKQTADSDTNRGPLRIDEPHVSFDQFSEFAWHGVDLKAAAKTEVQIGLTAGDVQVVNTYSYGGKNAIAIRSTDFKNAARSARKWTSDYVQIVASQPITNLVQPEAIRELDLFRPKAVGAERISKFLEQRVVASPRRGLLLPVIDDEPIVFPTGDLALWSEANWYLRGQQRQMAEPIWEALAHILHLPGHRGNPKRLYPYTVVTASNAPAPFSDLYAGVLLAWTESGEEGTQKLKQVADIMKAMGLAWKVEAIRQTTSHIKIQVSRTPTPSRAGARDLVSLPDVGFGVSQILPVVVALVHAQPGQLVYIEQPEIHLHPKAQEALAEAVVRAVRRGVRFVVETHSESILLTFQTAIARGDLPASDVLFHWFKRGEQGESIVESKVPDHAGRYGDLPFDFGDTLMDLQAKYIRAAHQAEKKHQKAKAAPNA